MARLEFLVEPFVVNEPGPHVTAAVDAVSATGELSADMGPFATTADGDLETIIEAATSLLRVGFAEGATSIQLRIERSDAG